MTMRAEFETLINTLGVPGLLVQAASPNASVFLSHVGIATVKGSEAIVNSLGIGTQVVTLTASSLKGYVPVKFDRVSLGGRAFMVLEHIAAIHDVGTGDVIGYKGYVRGKT